MNNIIGVAVVHKNLGKGYVVKMPNTQYGNYIAVKFENGKEAEFILSDFPDFFSSNSAELNKFVQEQIEKREKEQKRIEEKSGQEEKNRWEEIRRVVNLKHIEAVLHFTSIDNLKSILENEVLSRDEMKKKMINAAVNDELRLDFCPNCISCSISLPNAPLLFKFKKTYPDRKYVILKLKPELLWEKQCLFCKENAASNNVHLACDLSKPEALERMFGDYDTKHTRKGLENLYADGFIKDNMPTHNQAEVLVMGKIERKYIAGIYFFEEDIRNILFRNKLLELFKEGSETDFSFEKVPDDFMRRCKNPEKAFWQDTKSVRSDVNQDIYVPYDEIPF